MATKHLKPIISQIETVMISAQELGLVKKLPIPSIVFAFLGSVPHFFDSAPLIDYLWGIDPLQHENVEAHADTLVEMYSSGLLTEQASEGENS